MTDDAQSDAHKAIVRALIGIPPTEGQYQAIGRFFHEFSQLEFSLRFVLAQMLRIPNDYFDIVTSPYDTNALCMVVRALANKAFAAPNAEALVKCVKDVQKLNIERNRIAHGTWTDGDSGLTARHVARDTLEAKYHYGSTGELAALADRATALQGRIITVYSFAARNMNATTNGKEP